MLICHCRAVNDQTIRATILAGARDAPDVTRKCGAGSSCGGCVPALQRLLDEAARQPADASARSTAA